MYLNGEEHQISCESLEVKLCENCRTNLRNTVMGKRRAVHEEESDRRVCRRQDYERPQVDLQQPVMQEQRLVQNVCVASN